LTWRNHEWDAERSSWGNDYDTRHVCGRPQSRWEDVFVRWRGERWYEALVLDKTGYKKLADDFVDFSLSRQRKEGQIARLPKAITDDDAQKEVAPLPWLPWQPNIVIGHRRLELIGDSMLVANWANGVWPVRNEKYYEDIIDCCNILKTFADVGWEPRQPHCNFVRHVHREHNTVADSLASAGKNMPKEDVVILQYEYNRDKARFVRAHWDGGHGENEIFVGVGLHIDYSFETPHAETIWEPWLKAYGKCKGVNACDAEVSAFVTLVYLIQRTLMPQTPPFSTSSSWDLLPPWHD